MKKAFVCCFVFLFSLLTYGQETKAGTTENYTTFESIRQQDLSEELAQRVPQEWNKHPDYGILPHYAPCTNCFELIHLRTDSTRHFIEKGTNGKKIYLQTGDKTMHFRDENNDIRENTFLVSPSQEPGIFWAENQAEKVEFNVNKQQLIIHDYKNRLLSLNKNIEFWVQTHQGEQIRLYTASWNVVTCGENGMRVVDVFPGIDMEINHARTGIKTNFILKNNAYSFQQYRYIFIKDELFSGQIASYHFVEPLESETLYAGEVWLYDQDNDLMGIIEKGMVYDASQTLQADVFYKTEKNTFDLYVDASIFNMPNVSYPIVIDPTLQLTSTLALSSLSGSKYSSTCWDPSQYCSHDLTVNFPANVSFTGVQIQFGFSAPPSSYSCPFTGGAMRLVTENCISPDTTLYSPSYYECGGANPMFYSLCYLVTPNNFFDEFVNCLPDPACTVQTQVFSAQLFRCVSPGTGCSSNCITAYQPFIVTITGETLQYPALVPAQAGQSTIICQGDSLTLTGSKQFGVPPYSYFWTLNGETSDSLLVSPDTTTIYQLTITDLCGTAITHDIQIQVKPVNHTTIDSTICQTDLPFIWNQYTVNNVSPTDHILIDSTLINGCANTTTMHLSVHPTVYTDMDTSLCIGQFPFFWNGQSIAEYGTYLFTASSASLCDSVVSLTISPLLDKVIELDTNICEDGLPFMWNNQLIDQFQHYQHIDFLANGCDSTTSLQVQMIKTPHIAHDSMIFVENFPVFWFSDTIRTTGTYWHVDTLVSFQGCDSIVTYSLLVNTLVEEEIFYVPNSFTPQGDGYNEEFLPIITKGFDIHAYRMEIYNRWGSIIFISTDIHQGWNGLFKGEPVDDGVYTWNITLSLEKNGENRKVVGHVTITR